MRKYILFAILLLIIPAIVFAADGINTVEHPAAVNSVAVPDKVNTVAGLAAGGSNTCVGYSGDSGDVANCAESGDPGEAFPRSGSDRNIMFFWRATEGGTVVNIKARVGADWTVTASAAVVYLDSDDDGDLDSEVGTAAWTGSVNSWVTSSSFTGTTFSSGDDLFFGIKVDGDGSSTWTVQRGTSDDNFHYTSNYTPGLPNAAVSTTANKEAAVIMEYTP